MPISRLKTAPYQPTKRLTKIERTMRAHFVVLRVLGRTGAATPEAFYGFRALDVSEMYFHKAGVGRGLWYRLKDGRVFDGQGRRSSRRRALYSVRLPKPIKVRIILDPPVVKIGRQIHSRNVASTSRSRKAS
jgi:hypothetical protein